MATRNKAWKDLPAARIREAYEVALAQIRENREAIEEVTEKLIEEETISGDDFRAILEKYTEIPVENKKFLEKVTI